MNFLKLTIFCLALSPLVKADVAERRTSRNGAVFTRDLAHPQLGEAYRDPSGLVWGDLARGTNARPLRMNAVQAEAYCEARGARQPTAAEYRQLSAFIGRHHWYGADYSPFFVEEGTYGHGEVIPGLAEHGFEWGSGSGYMHTTFIGDSGVLGQGNSSSRGGFARCVAND